MTWTLAIDTSRYVAVGLARDGEPRIRVVVDDTRAHAEALMPSVLNACAEAGIGLGEVTEIAVGMGPGPFTGLRVGIATAWSLAHAAGLTPHGVCSLDVVAAQWADAPAEFVVAADARRKELYWAQYRDGVRVGDPRVSGPAEVPGLPLAGHLPEPTGLTSAAGAPTALDPAVLAAAWTRLPAASGEPIYLRAPDASVPGKPKSALPRLRVKR